MKKTQPIDWDKVNIYTYEYLDCFVVFFTENCDIFYLDKDFIAAFDEMLENEIKNNDLFYHECCYFDENKGWVFHPYRKRQQTILS